jgi:hypothetical protein
MPDDHHPLMPRRNPEDIDLGPIKTDLEFLIEGVTRFRKEQAVKPLYVTVVAAVPPKQFDPRDYLVHLIPVQD